MNKFQRILLASGLAATASLMGNSAVFAQSVTGKTATVNLSGTVPSTLTITVTPTAAATNLPLILGDLYTPTKLFRIATITAASTNSPNGLKVTVTSNGLLQSGANSIAFVGFGEGSTALNGPSNYGFFSTYISNPLQVTKSTLAGSAPDSNIFIGYSVPANQAPGTYTGSITFTATDN